MSDHWFFLNTGRGAASWNMALDEALLESLEQIGRPILRLYGWIEPAASFGYFQKYADAAAWTRLRPLVRRPTAGGLVPHDADWTYSLFFPPMHEWYSLRAEESYQEAHEWVADSLGALRVNAKLAPAPQKELPGRCFIGAEKFDVIAGGKKVAGAAQKRNKFGLLIQGSVQHEGADQVVITRADWEQAFLKSGRERHGIQWRELTLNESILRRAAELDAEKYSTLEFNRRR